MSSRESREIVLPHEVDLVTQYIFHNYRSLMTPAEWRAYERLIFEGKMQHISFPVRLYREEKRGPLDPEAEELLEAGARAFLIATRNRILRDHADEVFLNRCPKCSAITRTPKACLCPVCNHTWYETRKVG